MLKAKLVVVGGDAKAAEISLSLPTVIGRGREANLTLPHPLVSRQHCELFEKDGSLHVRDMKSLNGTYVDSQRIEATSILKPDQLLTIGNVTFRAIYSSDDSSVAQISANASNVIEMEQVKSSADSDSKIDPCQEEDSVHSRPTVKKPAAPQNPAAQKSEPEDLLKTVHVSDIGRHFSENSDVLHDFGEQAPDASNPAPQHSIVAALHQAGVTQEARDDATINELRNQLPNEEQAAAASGIDGLVVDPSQAPAERANLSSLDLDEPVADKVESDESALGSFIRKLPR